MSNTVTDYNVKQFLQNFRQIDMQKSFRNFSWFQFHEKYCKTSEDGCDFTENRVKTENSTVWAAKGLVTNIQINSDLENVNKLSFET